MADSESPFSALFAELRRRRVLRVAIVYVVVAWVLIQVGDAIFPALLLPDWSLRALIAFLALGFPVAVVLAWALEITPDGVRRTQPVSGPEEAGVRPAPRTAGLALFGAGILFALVAFGLTSTVMTRDDVGDGPSSPADRSIAVLPFADMSPDGDQAYFSDGITEDILTRLAQIPDLRVTSRTSVMAYKGSDKSLRQIGQELDVAYVLEGSVRRAGDRVRITGQLIDARTDGHLWAENYDRELTDVFAVQADIAQRIADALELRLNPETRARVAGGGTSDIGAYELYLRAREILQRPYASTAGLRSRYSEASALLRQALELDAAYAPAHTALASAYRRHPDLERDARYDSATAYSRRALELDPRLPDAFVELGRAYELKGQREAAVDQYRQALRLSPSHADAISEIATHHREAGRLDEALRDFRRAAALDPAVLDHALSVAFTSWSLGMFDDAERWLRRALSEIVSHPGRLNCHLADLWVVRGDLSRARSHIGAMLRHEPDGSYAHGCAGFYYLFIDPDLEAAAAHFERAVEIEGNDEITLWGLGVLALRQGDRAGAEALLDRAERQAREDLDHDPESRSARIQLAAVLAIQGEEGPALAALSEAVELGWRDYYEVGNVLDDLFGDDPDYRRLMAGVKADVDRMRERVEREGW